MPITLAELLAQRETLARAKRLLGSVADKVREESKDGDDEAFVLVLEHLKEGYDKVSSQLDKINKTPVGTPPKPRAKRARRKS